MAEDRYGNPYETLDVSRYIDFDGINRALDEQELMDAVADYTPELRATTPQDEYDDEYWMDRDYDILRGSVNPTFKKVAGNLADFLLGEENEKYEGGEDFFDNVPIPAYFVPYAGQMLWAGSVANDLYTGKRKPGALDVFGLGAGAKATAGALRGAGRIARNGSRAFMNGYNGAKARRRAMESIPRIDGPSYVEPPKYRLYDKDGNELLRNRDKVFRRNWY